MQLDLQVGHIRALARGDSGGGLQALDFGGRRQLAQDDESVGRLALGDHQRGETGTRLGVIRDVAEYLVEDLFCELDITIQYGVPGSLDVQVCFGWQEPIHPLSHRRLRQCSGEPFDGLSILEGHNGRYALDLELAGEVLVGIDVHFHQIELGGVIGSDPFERGAERLAGAAPLGPEVDHDGNLATPLQYCLPEFFGGDVFDVAHGE